jgi:D-alanyl-D-alanine dipeptidase
MKPSSLLSFLFCLFLLACRLEPETQEPATLAIEEGDSLSFVMAAKDTQGNARGMPEPVRKRQPSALELTLQEQGLVNVSEIEPEFQLAIKYSTEDNFLARDVYGDFDQCYLQPEVSEMLVDAQNLVRAEHPRLRFLLYDCVRPRSVQHQMWEIVKGTEQQRYVARPTGGGSMHNYGAAVDLGLIHLDTGVVDMGTPFDFFGELAQPRFETKFLIAGNLTEAQVENRLILRQAMRSAGFHMINSEWWHFNAFARPEVRQRYSIVE